MGLREPEPSVPGVGAMVPLPWGRHREQVGTGTPGLVQDSCPLRSVWGARIPVCGWL